VFFLFALSYANATQDAWSLIRVDEPLHDQAIATSHTGSVLLAPPEDGSVWRTESVPEVDGIDLSEVWDERVAEVTGIDKWHKSGFLGQGVRIAVFDIQWFGAALRDNELGETQTHDCWADPLCEQAIDTLRPRFGWEMGSHGVACAEIIRELAPEAELHLVHVNGLTTFENAIEWAIREQIDIISMSMTFFNESFYDGTGPISEQIDKLEEAGILMVTSAGNNAERHYEDTFRDNNNNGYHEFLSGSEYLPIQAESNDGRVAALLWDEFDQCGQSDFRIELFDVAGNLIRSSDKTQTFNNEKCVPVERIRAPIEMDGGWAYLRIERRRGQSSVSMDIMSFSGSIWGAHPQNSMADPATHPLAFSIGAVNVDDYLHNPVEFFSSQGPGRAGLIKPNLAAPDGLSTRTYGVNRFYGTSAAAPVVASALAVRMSESPKIDPRTAAVDLQNWAMRASPYWTQPEASMGYGRLRLPNPAQSKDRGCNSGPLRATLLLLPCFAIRRKRITKVP